MSVVLIGVAAAAIATPARAEVTGVIQCSATASANSYEMCTFVVEPGTYDLDLTSSAAYATASVVCNGGLENPIVVSVTGGGHTHATGRLLDPLCTLEVRATSGGTATGRVLRIGN